MIEALKAKRKVALECEKNATCNYDEGFHAGYARALTELIQELQDDE